MKLDKLRVVFGYSARYKGSSLNDHLPGPDTLNNLSGVIFRFRQHPVALMCDIQKMFHQFLWWNQGDLNSQPSEFHMKVHIFGAASPPGCANYELKHLAQENQQLCPKVSHFIMRNLYADYGEWDSMGCEI